ncbi:hypothetical protein Tco_1500490 [Tanacetum coccineum]
MSTAVLEIKFEGDNTLIVIQPPCYSASKDFQDSPDDEEDTRSSQEYMDNLEEEYQARALLAKSKDSSKGTQMFNSAKSTDKLNTTNVARNGSFYLRPTKDFEAKNNKAKDKIPSHPSAPTPVVAEMHKEAQQAADLMKDTRSAFFNPDYPTDEPITVTDESEEEKAEKHKEAHSASHNEPEDTSASHPPSPKSIQL